jgi:hopanoid biosynthesis associated protein HpnK
LTATSKRLIVTADDFGLAIPVNEAIEQGHRRGVLSTTSLMVAAPATADAVDRARRTPTLRVGLHVVLVNGKPALPPERVPLLVNERGEFEQDLFRAGLRYFFTPGIREQLEAEIRAQFAAFAATGLPLDHVNAQNHMHVHPTILSLLIKAGRDYGVKAIRIPREPFLPSWRATHSGALARLANSVLLAPWLALMRARLNAADIVTNDFVFGMNDSGRMTPQLVASFLRNLPRGTSEVYVHPATHTWPEAFPPDYDFAGEFAALVDPQVARTVAQSSIRPITFTELATNAG